MTRSTATERLKQSGPGVRTGEDYLNALNDGRRVYINGELVDNMATHPKTRYVVGKDAKLRMWLMHLPDRTVDSLILKQLNSAQVE